MKTFFYTTEEIAAEAVEYGLKLSHVARETAPVYGKNLPCIVTYLHPADCPRERRGAKVLKLQLEDSKAFIAEGMFTGERYAASLVAAKEYRLGMYRQPRCLLICSVFPEQIEPYDSNMDEPLLYESSEQLYRDTVLCRVQESEEFRELALQAYYERCAAEGRYIRVEEQNTVLYLSPDDGKIIFAYNCV